MKIKNGKFEENKEFLVSISLFYGFIELFDLEEENNPISTIPAVDFNNYVIYAKVYFVQIAIYMMNRSRKI